MIKGTEEQEKIWNELENGDSHVMVYAGAGTGKTFTIVQGSMGINGKKMGFLAFNKAIVKELDAKLPLDCKAVTFHSLGLAAIKRIDRRSKVSGFKTRNIIEIVLGKKYKSKTALAKLISLMKSSMVFTPDVRRSTMRDIISEYNIEFDGIRDLNNAFTAMPDLYRRSVTTQQIDFDDMIWLPIVMQLSIEHFDVLFVDEAQDFNEAQRQLILKACNGGRMVVVGDPNQAIYGFRGADSASMGLFESTLEESSRGVKKFTLSKTFRCPKSIVAEANRYVPEYHCHDDADEGTVTVNATFNPSEGDMVLCRVNAPLIEKCFAMIADGRPAYVLGRDIGTSLKSLVKKVKMSEDMPIEIFLPKLKDYVTEGKRVLRLQEKDKQAEGLQDRYDCIVHLTRNAVSIKGLLDNIETIFKDGKNRGVVFSTIHKAKGLESNSVWIIKTDVMPHPMAKSAADRKQENNLCYVAITRAMKNLYYVGDRVGKA